MDDFIASLLVEHDQQDSHQGNDTQQDHGVGQRIPNLGHGIWALFMEWCVSTAYNIFYDKGSEYYKIKTKIKMCNKK